MSCLLVLLVGAAGCSRTFKGNVTQPNPLVAPNETLRDSEPVVIITGDMELTMPKEQARLSSFKSRRYPLQNVASFTVVSRDRLRFHVQLEHKWQDWADPAKGWTVTLIDDQGRTWEPESVESRKPKLLVTMWDQEVRSVVRSNGEDGEIGDIVHVRNDGWRRRMPLGSLSVFRGRADFVFYQRDIFTTDIKWMKLVVRRPGVGFEFRWDFADSVLADLD
jgi:hypothetical protein